MAKRCSVCVRLYAGYQCPCRKKQHSRARRAAGGGRQPRRWRQAQREARVLGGLPVDTAAAPEHAGSEQWYVCPRCDAVFTGDRCPACWERWQAERAGAGDPDGFRIVEDATATRCVLPVPGGPGDQTDFSA